MELPEGMVAVVRSLPESGLAVSVLEGGREYTLMPNNTQMVPQQPQQFPFQIYGQAPRQTPVTVQSTSTEMENRSHEQQCNSSAQVVDGRYASVYQMSHCNVSPSSPPVLLTEFPPQRPELLRGQGNFVVGGYGSGESAFSPTRTNGNYKGGLNWPERGAVCAPRQSHKPDAFAQSLRKYPALSPERSAEVIDRLVNFTAMKNTLKGHLSRSYQASPTRSETNSNPGYDRKSCVAASMKSPRNYDADINQRSKVEESPVKEMLRKCELDYFDYRKSPFGRSYDVRHVRDITNRRLRDSLKNVSTYPYGHPVCPAIKERYDHLPPERKVPEVSAMSGSCSVHTETQACATMISREVATVPRMQVSKRNVAVPLSPSSSQSDPASLQSKSSVKVKLSCKSIQTPEVIDLSLQIKKSVQTCISSIDVPDKKKKVKSCRKSKSQEEIRLNDDLEEEILQLIKDLSLCPDLDTEFGMRNQLLRRLRKIHKTDRSDRVRIKFGRCIREHLYSQMDLKNFTNQLSKELLSKIKEHTMFLGSRSRNASKHDVNTRKKDDNCIDELIKEWLDDIPVKQLDYLGRNVKKEQILLAVAGKIKYLIMSKVQPDGYNLLKPEILDIIEDMPIEINARNKTYYLHKKVNDIVKKIENIFFLNAADSKKTNKAAEPDKTLRINLKKDQFVCGNVQPTEKELKQFVKQELKEFCTKFHVKICPNTENEIVVELVDILIDSIEAIRYGNDEQVKEEMLIWLADLIEISQLESTYFINNLLSNLKERFKEPFADSMMPQTFVVLQNNRQNACMQTQNPNEFSIEGIANQEIQNNIYLYTCQIVQQINEWMLNIRGISGLDASFKQVVVNDLAEDIVDRHKYLELNPSSKVSDADELEHLKYQIFKWVNKLVGEENLETIEQASDLMRRIHNIPVPTLTRPVYNVDTKIQVNVRKSPIPSETADHQCRKRRLTDPGTASEMPGRSALQTNPTASKRRETSPDIFAMGKCCATGMIPQDLGITDQSRNRTEIVLEPPIENSPISKRAVFTETDMPQILETVPKGTSMFEDEPARPMFVTTSTSVRYHDNFQEDNISRPPIPPVASEDMPCCSTQPTTKQINDEYDEYLLNWVQRIPIVASDTVDEKLIQKMRLGIYNGIWKAITKINMNPAVVNNPFYYQDLMDDELEQLLDLLPTSTELANKKDLLKTQLIEKTTETQKQIIDNVASSSYKQQLVENISNVIPRNLHEYHGDPYKVAEDVLILQIAEQFMLISRYAGHDNVKATIYKKKLIKSVQELFDDLKRRHGKQMTEMKMATYKDEMMDALHSVPMPSDDTLKEEVDQILLGLEIEQWFADLPLNPASTNVENFFRLRYRDSLAKNVYAMEKQNCLADCEEQLRHNITRFLERLPLLEGQEKNTPFIAEELINRLKNRPKDVMAGSDYVKNFMDPNSYDQFSGNMQFCSSFSDAPNAKRAQIDESSFMIVGGQRANAQAPLPYGGQHVQYRDKTPDSQQEWLSMAENTLPSVIVSGTRPSRASSRVVQSSYGRSPGKEVYVPQNSVYPQASRNETVGPNQISFYQPVADPMVEPRMQIQNSLRQDPSLHTPRITPASGCHSGNHKGKDTLCGSSTQQNSSAVPGPSHEGIWYKSISPGRQSELRPGGSPRACSSRPYEGPSTNRDPSPMTQRMGQFSDAPVEFLGNPVGFSTPQENASIQRESRPRRRFREVDRSRRETAKRRIDVDDTEESDKVEVRCRCMERVWRRKKRPLFYPCENIDVDYPTCFPIGYPFAYYY